MRIERIAINAINPAKYNPRRQLKPGDAGYEKLKKSVQEFGLVDPLILNARGNVLVGGHQRLTVLKELGYTEADVSIIDLPPEKEKALNIALNKIGGEWDNSKLSGLLQELSDVNIDIGVTGFTSEELNNMVAQSVPVDIDALLSEVNVKEAVIKPIWLVARAEEASMGILEKAAVMLEQNGIRVERSYDVQEGKVWV